MVFKPGTFQSRRLWNLAPTVLVRLTGWVRISLRAWMFAFLYLCCVVQRWMSHDLQTPVRIPAERLRALKIDVFILRRNTPQNLIREIWWMWRHGGGTQNVQRQTFLLPSLCVSLSYALAGFNWKWLIYWKSIMPICTSYWSSWIFWS